MSFLNHKIFPDKSKQNTSFQTNFTFPKISLNKILPFYLSIVIAQVVGEMYNGQLIKNIILRK